MPLTDSHCHLAAPEFAEDLEAVLRRARAAGVTRAVVIGTTPEDSRAALTLVAQDHGAEAPALSATAGLHPHQAARFDDRVRAELRELCALPHCVAVGETGLDWFKEWAPRPDQLASFQWHLELARSLERPVVVHSRDAHEDTAAAIEAFPGVRGVMHCYSYGTAEAARYLDAGLYLSFSGNVTFPRSVEIQAAAAACPEDRILFETDAPYLAPVPHRGKRNEPAHCVETLRFVAKLRGMDPIELMAASERNAETLFRRAAHPESE